MWTLIVVFGVLTLGFLFLWIAFVSFLAGARFGVKFGLQIYEEKFQYKIKETPNQGNLCEDDYYIRYKHAVHNACEDMTPIKVIKDIVKERKL